MRPLTARELLTVWERGANQSIVGKTLSLLGVACSVTDLNIVARLSIGDRDARLLRLREWIFGHKLTSMATCPACAQVVEWEMDSREFRLQEPAKDTDTRIFHFEDDQHKIQFRLPDTRDILKVLSKEDHAINDRDILYSCVIEANVNGQVVDAGLLSSSVLTAIDQRMSQEDPQADIKIKLTCVSCSHQWEARFDIMTYLWSEINGWCHRLMQEVCLLARSFGWSEAEILDMSSRRRQLYIEMLRS